MLTKYEMERRIWQEFGQTLKEFYRRPWREVEKYLAIMQISDREAQLKRMHAQSAVNQHR